MSAHAPILGIDLGTTYSLVAIAGWPDSASADQRAPRIIPDDQGRPLCPSVVRFNADRTVTVGYDAKCDAPDHPLTTIASVKRLMGRSAADAQADASFRTYQVIEGPSATARVRLPDGRVLSPQEVSAHILAHLRTQAERALGVPITKAVITVPAYFDDAQRQATRHAGQIAGLEVIRIVAEPTAAALAYGLGLRAAKANRAQTVVVYDLGGGTFDVSVLRMSPLDASQDAADAFTVLATGGDTHLGGDDFDHALFDLFTREIARSLPLPEGGARGGLSPSSTPSTHHANTSNPSPAIADAQQPSAEQIAKLLPPESRRALAALCEQVKIRLSSQPSASIDIDLGSSRYQRTITREEFEALITPHIDRSLAIAKRTLREARRAMEGDELAAVVLVGGSTRIPLVRRKVAELFGLEPYTALDPDHVVALGAAVQASILSGASRDALLLDVIPLSLGVETAGGAVAKLIVKNSTVPAVATEMFSTSVDGQSSIKLHVLQGEREMASDCRSLGVYHLPVPPMPAGIPQLKVQFLVDANGILSVSAVEQRSGRTLKAQIIPNHGLTPQEVERIERESFANARSDMAQHRVVDLIANSKLDLHWTNQALAKHAALLPADLSSQLNSAIATLQGFITRAEQSWQSVNPDEFHAAKDALDKASVRLHEIAITQSLKS